MLGHLKPTFCSLSKDDKENYWEFYCAICASLRKQNHNTAYSLLLNNELTLLLAAFQDEFETLTEIETRCPATVFITKKFAFSHEAIDLAGQLSVLLGWIKALDWHTDKPHFLKKILVNKLRKKVSKFLPSLQPESQAVIAQYVQITIANEQDFEVIRLQSALLSQMLVKEIALKVEALPETTALLCTIFGKAGEIIAIADHLIDLEKDQETNQYNPIVYYSEKNQTPLAEEYTRLRMAFNLLRYEIEELLPQTNPSFAVAFRQSLRNLTSKITKNLPACMRTEEARLLVGKVQTTQAGFHQLPSVMPAGSDCCNEESCKCCVGCSAACCEVCASGCCTSFCDTCCDKGCECGGDSSTAAERQARRNQRRIDRANRREQRRKERQAKKDAKKGNKNNDKDDTYE